jgi:hypothetical protein
VARWALLHDRDVRERLDDLVDVFEQCLAVANFARMLRPGGLLLTNSAIFEVPVTPLPSEDPSTSTIPA